MKPVLLDLYCGAGGMAKGFKDAGFYVVGVDIKFQPHYPGDEFIQADALEFLKTDLSRFHVHHASPKCQGFSTATRFHRGAYQKHENHIPDVRKVFSKTGKPYIIENVSGAPLLKSVMLCGTMFGLRVRRHRYFETNFWLQEMAHPRICRKKLIKIAGPSAIAKEDEYWCVGGHFGEKYEAALAMGIDWMHTQEEIGQAIPPAYAEWIGKQVLAYLENVA